jgi:hypothetical protein
MNYKYLFLKTNRAGFVLGAALLVTLSECNVYAGDLRIGIDLPVPVVVVAPPVVVVAPPVVVEDDYVYYPGYGVYYNSSRHLYAYMDGGVWVSRPAPIGVSVDVLLASPSVRMDFHDSPEKHHAMMLQKYPRDWKRADADHDRNEKDRKDDHHDQRDDHRDNGGR